ncbi:transcriptional regulator, TetR family [Anaerovirgula multivorans]|uniref:Transcriptional regulator, TetR family n=1 Tax=Anaerovirgula multivorans TaxID=312168 RepID=A0A239HF90_9FIRM|nr:TetR/AcrR family transcriptional regulator [Anaerovirgula multivorans]SNS79708.1 transcriptional regulator, TetR family [Anaerovirgula multivorans]
MAEITSKRDLIIQAAIQVFARSGFYKAKVGDIAETAGVGKGTIYEYFNSKDHLFEEMVHFSLDTYITSIKNVLFQNITTESKLREFFLLIIRFTQKHMDIMRIFSQEAWRSDNNIVYLMMDAKKQIVTLVEEVLTEAVNKGEFRPIDEKIAAIIFLGGINYMVMYHVSLHDDHITEEQINQYIDLFIKGLKSHQ